MDLLSPQRNCTVSIQYILRGISIYTKSTSLTSNNTQDQFLIRSYSTPFVLGTSSPPVRVIASLIARARALKADSALYAISVQKFCIFIKIRHPPVVIVVSAKNIDVQRNSSRYCEGVKDVGEHLGREVSYLLAFDTQICHTERPRADVNDRAREGLNCTTC